MNVGISKIRLLVLAFLLTYILASDSTFASVKKDTTASIDFKTAFNSEAGNAVLAQVGNDKITVREFLAGYEFGPAYVKRKKDSKKLYLKYLINEKLMAQEGYKRGFADSSQVKNLLEAIRGDLSTTELFNSDIFDSIKISQLELNKVIGEKRIIYKLEWLYAPQKDSLEYYLSRLKKGFSFDSLFQLQLKDSVYADQRSMEMDKLKLRMQNPEMFRTVDTMKPGDVSEPVKGTDGFYIVKIINIWKNEILTQSESNKDEYDAVQAIKLNESDRISDAYVRKMMLEHNPVIQARAFDVLRSYLGSYVLTKDKFNSWKLDERMQKELDHFDTLDTKQIGELKLISLTAGEISLDDFLNWYKLRDGYLKFDETDFNSFSASLERQIWQMVRDHLLIQRAYSRGFQNMEMVRQQVGWWRDKIIYAVVRDEMANSVGLNIEDPKSLNSKFDNKRQSLIEKTFRKLQQLRKEYKVKINEQILDKIKVNDSDSPRTIDTYIIKKGGTFPHPAFPSIDYSWDGLD